MTQFRPATQGRVELLVHPCLALHEPRVALALDFEQVSERMEPAVVHVRAPSLVVILADLPLQLAHLLLVVIEERLLVHLIGDLVGARRPEGAHGVQTHGESTLVERAGVVRAGLLRADEGHDHLLEHV